MNWFWTPSLASDGVETEVIPLTLSFANDGA